MSKKAIFGLIILNLIITFVAVLFLAGYVSAKIATTTWLAKYKIFNPQSPIVINRREEVRVSDSADVQEAVSRVRSRVSMLARLQDGKLEGVANLVNLTSDGYFFTAKTAAATNQSYVVITADGRSSPVVQIVSDPASGIALLKASLTDMAVAPFGDSTGLETGQKIIFVHATFSAFGVSAQTSFVAQRERDAFGTDNRSDYRSRSFGVQSVGVLVPGEAIYNLNGDLIGIWDGISAVPSSILSKVQQLFFDQKQRITRSALGFEYQNLSKAEGLILKTVPGARVTVVAPGSAAATGGLKAGDVIVRMAGDDLNDQKLLEEILDNLKPNEVIPVVVNRDNKQQALSLKPAALQ